MFSFRATHDESDNDTNTSSSDTNFSSIPPESHADINDSHDNNESIGGIVDGGLASFVKSSSINDDYCKFHQLSVSHSERVYILCRSSK